MRAVLFYRILPGKSAEKGRQVLGGYRGTVVADGFAVYEVLARDGPGFTLAQFGAHTKRKFEEIASQWPAACAEIAALILTCPEAEDRRRLPREKGRLATSPV